MHGCGFILALPGANSRYDAILSDIEAVSQIAVLTVLSSATCNGAARA